jgi:hypothetical protein
LSNRAGLTFRVRAAGSGVLGGPRVKPEDDGGDGRETSMSAITKPTPASWFAP